MKNWKLDIFEKKFMIQTLTIKVAKWQNGPHRIWMIGHIHIGMFFVKFYLPMLYAAE